MTQDILSRLQTIDMALADLNRRFQELEQQTRKSSKPKKRVKRPFTHLNLTKTQRRFVDWFNNEVEGDRITYASKHPPGIQLSCPTMERPFEACARAASDAGYLETHSVREDRKVINKKGNQTGKKNYDYFEKTDLWRQHLSRIGIRPIRPV